MQKAAESRQLAHKLDGAGAEAPFVPLAKPASLSAFKVIPEANLHEKATRSFDAKPWQAGLSLRQLKSFCTESCGKDFEILRNECQVANLQSLQQFAIAPLTKGPRCSLSQILSAEGLLADVFVVHSRGLECRDFLDQLEWFAHVATSENLVDKINTDDVSFWISSFSLNQYRKHELFDVQLEETPFVKALQRTRCLLLVLDDNNDALLDLWVIYAILEADKSGKTIEVATSNLLAACSAMQNLSAGNAKNDSDADRHKLVSAMQSYHSTLHGAGGPAATLRLRYLISDMLFRQALRSRPSGEIPDVLLENLREQRSTPSRSKMFAELAAQYGNLELLDMCVQSTSEPASVGGVALVVGEMGQGQGDGADTFAEVLPATSGTEENTAPPSDAEIPHDASGVDPTEDSCIETAEDVEAADLQLPPAVPMEALEQLNIGVDFAQRLAILWAANLEWPEIITWVLRWPIILSLDLGIIFPGVSPALRAVFSWLWPYVLILAVCIVDKLHGGSGATWDVMFIQRWRCTGCWWLLVFFAVCALLAVVAVLVSEEEQELPLLGLVNWCILNFLAAVMVLAARRQASKTERAAEEHGLDITIMMAGFHNFMRHSLCTLFGLLFVASWLPPVRASLNTAMRLGAEGLGPYGLGVAMMLTSSLAFLVPSVFLAVLAHGVKATYHGVPVAWLLPLPVSLFLWILAIFFYKIVFLSGEDDFAAAAGFMLPWSVLAPVVFSMLSLQMFLTHPFGALIAGDFRFQYHRIVSILLRILFASSAAAPSLLSAEGAVTIIPGLSVLIISVLYVAIFRPYRVRAGNTMDMGSSAVLALMVAIPVLPRSDVGDACIASIPVLFFFAWLYSLRPKTTLRALWHSPERMRAKLQATIHSPEWIYAKPLADLLQMAPQEALFWNVRHAEALADRLQAVVQPVPGAAPIFSSMPPKLRVLLKLCASDGLDPEARLAAASFMQDLNFGDDRIYAAALRLRLEFLGRQLQSTDAALRCSAAKALGELGEPAADQAKALAMRCQATWEEEAVRVSSAEALGGIGPAAAEQTKVLADMLVDKSTTVRDAAAEALGKLGDAAFERQELVQSYDEGHPFRRIAHARVMERGAAALVQAHEEAVQASRQIPAKTSKKASSSAKKKQVSFR